jgi:putative SOS response-associated peptidase YedK
MCGRFTQTKASLEKAEQLVNIDLPPLFQGRYNIAPTQPVAAIRTEVPDRITSSTWGFPAPQGTLVINARMETLREKPLFRNLLEDRRCLILADGFYEWKAKQPYYFQLPDRALFAFAGLWRPRADDPATNECVIITRPAGPEVKPIHDRMPVILRPDAWPDWIREFRLPGKPPGLTARPVSPRVNRVANDDPSCIDPAPEQGDLFA